jgi:uncharacterized RDD family membrane protein YckC
MFCTNCGNEIKEQTNACPTCGAPFGQPSPPPVPADIPGVPASPPPPPPSSTATPETPPSDRTAKDDRIVAGLRVAGLGDRLIAMILDSMLVMALFAVVGMWISSLMGGRVKGGFSTQGMPAFIIIGSTMLLGFVYFWFLESLAGGTLGKRMMGLKVRSTTGARCTLTQSLIRNLLRIVDGQFLYLVGFFIALFSKLRQRLGDHLAKTVVLEAPPGTFLRIIFVVLWLAIIVGALWGSYVIYTRFPAQVP